MPLPISMDATWLNGSVAFNAQELRRADAALLGGDGTAFGVRGGIVRHGDNSLAVTVNSSDVVTVQPGAVVIPANSGVGNGAYRAALGAAETGNLAARNATNPRIDLVVFRVLDTDVVGSHGAFTGRIEVIAGTPAASPVAPALPSLAVELARITVPASAGGSATVDSSNRLYSTVPGGVLTVASFSKLPASAPKWQRAVLLDTGLRYVYSGSAWEADPADAAAGAWKTWTPVWTNITTPGTVSAKYREVGRTVDFRLLAINTGQTGNGAQIQFTLPVPPDLAGIQWSYPFRFYTGGTDQYLGFGVSSSAFAPNKIGLYITGSGQTYSSASFFNGSNFDIGGTYQAAS